MDKKKFLVVGGGGREGAFAYWLARDATVYAVMSHENPTIQDCVLKSGGKYAIDDADDPQVVQSFARRHAIDYTFVSADQPLANGVVDVLQENGHSVIGGTQEASRIEWDKVYAMEMIKETCPQFTPFYRTVSRAGDIQQAVAEFESRGIYIAVKPQGLTGGKGVRIMPEHLPTYQDCAQYAGDILEKNPGEKVLLVERLDGIEFTIMGITDGKSLIVSPASYDYPFRYDGDKGPGTGGMGCFTGPGKRLSFISDADIDDCTAIMRRIIDRMRAENLHFTGILNGGFFKTQDGIRFMEFNARFGDPEGLNVLEILDGSFAELLERICKGTLSGEAVAFSEKASVSKYLVAKEYPEHSAKAVSFTLDEDAIADLGIKVFFASCIRTGSHRYETLKKSRVAALVATADTIQEASGVINKAIKEHVSGALEYRQDIGSQESLEKITGA